MKTLIALALFLSYSAAACPGFQANRIYMIQSSQDENAYLHLKDGNTTNQNQIVTAPYSHSSMAQRWKVFPEADGFRISYHTRTHNFELPVITKSTTSGVHIYRFYGDSSQEWNAHRIGDTAYGNTYVYVIINVWSDCALQKPSGNGAVTCEPFDAKRIPATQKWRLNYRHPGQNFGNFCRTDH